MQINIPTTIPPRFALMNGAEPAQSDRVPDARFDRALRDSVLALGMAPDGPTPNQRLAERRQIDPGQRREAPSDLTAPVSEGRIGPDLAERAGESAAAPQQAQRQHGSERQVHERANAGRQSRGADAQAGARTPEQGPTQVQQAPSNAGAPKPSHTDQQQHGSEINTQAPRESMRAHTLDPRGADAQARTSGGVVAPAPPAQGQARSVQPAMTALLDAARASQSARTPQKAQPATQQSNLYKLEQEATVRQVSRALAQALRTKDGQITLRLTPRELGEVSVRIRVEGDTVSARIEPAREAAREALQAGVAQLREALTSRGYIVDRIEIADAPQQGAGSGRERDSGDAPAGNPDAGSRSDGGRGRETGAGGNDEKHSNMNQPIEGGSGSTSIDMALGLLRLDAIG